MSLVNQGKPSRMRSVYGHNSGTATEVVYTCPPNCVAEVTFIHIVNGGGKYKLCRCRVVCSCRCTTHHTFFQVKV